MFETLKLHATVSQWEFSILEIFFRTMKGTFMTRIVQNDLHSIRCLRAIAAYEGGYEVLAKKVGVQRQTIAQWVIRKSIPADKILPLTRLFKERISAEDLLGKYDNVK